MSKVSKLKQEAYQAGKKRDWDKVVVLYEHILDLEKNNPALINELGDICLKRGDNARAISHFHAAAEQYRLTGLLNNAVAIYKKVLRFDAGNLNAHWYLAESRAGQGLLAEGEAYALQFLAGGERVDPAMRDAFVQRCVKLLSLLPAQAAVLARLAELFRALKLEVEGARVALLQAGLAHAAGEAETAAAAVAALLARHPELDGGAEHLAWRRRRGEVPATPACAVSDYDDHNTIDLSTDAPAAPSAGPAPRRNGTSDDSLAQSLGLIDLDGDAPDAGGPAGFPLGDFATRPPAAADRDPGLERTGRAPLFGGSGPPVARPAAGAGHAARDGLAGGDIPSFADLARELGTTGTASPPPPPDDTVDLLAEILAEDGPVPEAAASRQVETIVSEIGRSVGGDGGQDPAAQYDLGLVYLEMELLDQAEACFEAAAGSPAHALRSYEMWGITLIRQARCEEAVDVLGRGLRLPGAGPGDQLGLLYHTGQAYELAGRTGAAREYYERVYQESPHFLDIEKRLEALESS